MLVTLSGEPRQLGDIQQTLAALLLVDPVDHLKEHLLIVQHIAQAIGAQEQIASLFQLLPVEVTQYGGLCAHGPVMRFLPG